VVVPIKASSDEFLASQLPVQCLASRVNALDQFLDGGLRCGEFNQKLNSKAYLKSDFETSRKRTPSRNILKEPAEFIRVNFFPSHTASCHELANSSSS
jgi:hypothetical protein